MSAVEETVKVETAGHGSDTSVEVVERVMPEGKYFFGAAVYFDNFQSPLIEVVVGGEIPETARTFFVHKGILCKSPFFSCALNGSFKEARESKVQLPEDDPEIFSSILEYLYGDEYSPRLVTRLNMHRRPQPFESAFSAVLRAQPQLRQEYQFSDGMQFSDGVQLRPVLAQREIEGYDGEENPRQQCAAAMRHARVYCMADKLGLEGLQILVLEKLRLCGPVRNTMFVKVASYLVENASDGGGQLTEFLEPFIPGIPGPGPSLL